MTENETTNKQEELEENNSVFSKNPRENVQRYKPIQNQNVNNNPGLVQNLPQNIPQNNGPSFGQRKNNPVFNQPQNPNPSLSQNQTNSYQNQGNPPKKPSLQEKIKTFLIKKWWVVLIAFLAIAVLVIGTYAYFVINKKEDLPRFENVQISIAAPQISPSGSVNNWVVTVKNNETVDIENVKVTINFPEKVFRFTNTSSALEKASTSGDIYQIERIQAETSRNIEFSGILTGNIDHLTTMSAKVEYVPKPWKYEKDNLHTINSEGVITRITSAELRLEVSSNVSKVESGGNVEITTVLRNQSQSDLSNIELFGTYPSENNFVYQSSELRLANSSNPKTQPDDNNNFWRIPTLPRGATHTLIVRGMVKGSDNTELTFDFQVLTTNANKEKEVLTQALEKIKISPQALKVSTYIDKKSQTDVILPKEKLTFVIDFENQTSANLKEVSITAIIDDPANIVDWNTFRQIGSSDVPNINANKSATWTSAGSGKLLNMAPGSKQQISFEVTTKNVEQFYSPNITADKYIITPKVEYKATDYAPVIFIGNTYKVSGGLGFVQTSTYIQDPADSNARIYTITWNINTKQNALKNLSIETSTPREPEAFDINSISPNEYKDNFKYDQATGRIRLDLDTVEPYYGLGKDSLSISFKIKVKKESGSFRNILVLRNIDIYAKDSVTDQEYKISEEEFETKD